MVPTKCALIFINPIFSNQYLQQFRNQMLYLKYTKLFFSFSFRFAKYHEILDLGEKGKKGGKISGGN